MEAELEVKLHNKKKNRKWSFTARRGMAAVLSIVMVLGTGAMAGCNKQSLTEYTDGLFTKWVQEDTLTLHYTLAYPENYGITDYPVTWGDYTLKSYEESVKESEAVLKALKSYKYNNLSAEEKLTYDVLKASLEADIKVSKMALYNEILGPTTGFQANLPVTLAEYQFNREQDVKDYLGLCKDLPRLMDQIIEFEKEKSKAGLFMSDHMVDQIVKQCQEFIADPDNNLLLETFDTRVEKVEGISGEQKEAYKSENAEVVKNSIITSYQVLIDGLTALKGTGTNEGGICGFPEGKQFYEYLVASDTGSSMTIKEIKRAVENRMRKDGSAAAEVYSQFPDSEVLNEQLAQSAFASSDPRTIMDELQGKIGDDFPALREVVYDIKYVDPSLQDFLSPAFYMIPPIDKPKENVIYINCNPGEEDSEIYPTVAHEGYPGHLYQTVFFSDVNAPKIRYLLNFSGYAEGWATYVENLSFQYADSMSEDVRTMRALDNSYLLGLYSLMDIGINYEGWSFEDFNDFTEEWFGVLDEEVLWSIFDYMVADPGVYLKYHLGCLEFEKLKEQAQKDWGGDYTDYKFHEAVLTIGPAPFKVISEHLNDYK